MRLRRTGPQRPPPTAAETAEYMRTLAETFVDTSHEVGYHFDWDPALLHHLDNYCGELALQHVPQERVDLLIRCAGAYLGEILVRSGGGVWAYDEAQNAARVDLPDGKQCWPANKIAKRVVHGPQHDLKAYYMYGVTGEVPRGSSARVIKRSLWERIKSRT